jgi:hypothetical protein
MTSTEAMKLAEQLSEFMKSNMEGDEHDENHINNKLMKIILPHQIYYNFTVYGEIHFNSEGASPDDKPLINLRHWTKNYHVNIDLPTSHDDDDSYSY